ncbi:serine hydrolase domain-containing protein [Novosphingobium olei]|uniref:Beta-lactamase family protein n=1 Tax=Novosphingobium olei TaxID=2728851 RepID=A0A7Y0BLE3_9SPHN|nr:serine hydrolase domain-containing protein [Novosphingobium olei]NML92606.1 beta-lactamase family protein [Novosphingobium olei]
MTISRRELLRSGAVLGAGLTLAPRWAWAVDTATDRAAAVGNYPQVASLVDRYATQGKLSGLVATAGWGEAPMEVIARGAGTKGDAHPIGPDSLFRIYSMTKPVTGMAAMILVGEGRLGLDQPLADIIPAFARMQVLVSPDAPVDHVRPATTAITIRHLLTHTSGLGYTIIQKGPIKEAYEKAGIVPGQVSRVPVPGLFFGKAAPNLAEFAERLAGLPLVYEPGTRWSYSVSLDLLGRVIEIVAGMPFDTFLRQRIFGPAGMTSTSFTVPANQAARLTTNYGLLGDVAVPLDPARTSVYLDKPAFPFGGAGLVSSPRDYDRFLMMLANGGRLGRTRVMDEAAVRLGTSNLLPPAAVVEDRFVKSGGFGAGGRVGLGQDAGTFGWAGAAGTVGFVNTRIGLRAGLYTQYMPADALPVQDEFRAAMLADVLARMKRAA